VDHADDRTRRDRASDVTPPGAEHQVTPTWATWREARHVVGFRPHLWATTRVALLVGTVLFAINHLDIVLRGDASTATWVKTAVTYLVPFTVANVGILIASRRRGA